MAAASRTGQSPDERTESRVRRVEWRCRRCGRLLAVGVIEPGSRLEIQCRGSKCKHKNILP